MYLQIGTYMKTDIPVLMDLSSASLKSFFEIWTLKASRMSFKSGSSTSIKRYKSPGRVSTFHLFRAVWILEAFRPEDQ